MKSTIIAAGLLAILPATAQAESFGKPCTTEPKEKWLSIEAIEKIVKEHGFDVAKSKLKNGCAEVYVRDNQGQRVELFIDPATGNPVGSNWKSPSK
jgi:hypothetical protein